MIVLVPASVHDELAEPAREAAPDARLIAYAEDDAPVADAENADAVLRWVAGKRYAQLIENGPNVRWLHTASAGVDHVLTPLVRAAANRLIITDSGPAFEIAISEFVLAWMLMVTRRLPDLLDNQRRRLWHPVTQDELWGKTAGIVGLGPIGRGIAARAKAFGMTTLGLRRMPGTLVENVDEVLTGANGLHRLLAESDFVILAAALTDETRHLLGAAELARLKPTCWLINVARGALVDEDALINTLRRGALAGACLDVFAREPLPAESPLWDLPNVYVAPHNAPGWTRGLRERQKRLFLDNLAKFARSLPLDGVVDVARGY